MPYDPTGPFSHYEATPEDVDAAADAVQATTGNIGDLDNDVVGIHRIAQDGVAGMLEGPMRHAPEPVRQSMWDWLRSVVFAGGAIRLWASAIRTFNQGIDDLNRRYRDAQANQFGVDFSLPHGATPEQRDAALDTYHANVRAADTYTMAGLRGERDTRLVPELDAAAAGVAGILDAGPDDAASVLWMFQAGTLPMEAPAVFTSVDFSHIDAYLLFNNLIKNGRLPASLTTMDEDEIFEWLKDHPGQANGIAVLLQLGNVMAPDWRRMLGALGRFDAWRVRRALNGDNDAEGLDRLGFGLERLEEINARVANGEPITMAEREYLYAWFNAVGGDKLRELATFAEGSPLHLVPVGEAIRNLADPSKGGVLNEADLPRGLLDAYTDPIRVFNLNAGEGNENMSWDPSEGTDRQDIPDLATIVLGTDANVVTLQEMFKGDAERLQFFLEAATGDRWELHFQTAMSKYQMGEHGIPVLEGGFRPFGNAVLVHIGTGIDNTNDLGETTLHEPDNWGAFPWGSEEGRSMTGAEIVTSNGGTMYVYSTHVASGEGVAARADQINQAGRVVAGAPTSVGLFGDFNSVPSEGGAAARAQVELVTERGLTDAVHVGGTEKNGTGDQIDRAYTRDVIIGEAQKVDGGPSDHHGFAVDMRVPHQSLDELADRFNPERFAPSAARKISVIMT